MIEIDDISDAPWNRGDWSGRFLTNDETPTTDVERDDIVVLVAYGETPADWDGNSAGIVITKDGRVISWESSWGPTGSGFHADAYGGDADILCSTRIAAALAAMSEQSRELIVWNESARQCSPRIDELLWVARDAAQAGHLDDADRIRREAIQLVGWQS